MKTIIQEGRYLKGPVYVAKCRKCKCKFTYEKEDIRRVGVYGFEHIIYVDCPWCEETIWLNRLKFLKKNKTIKPNLKAKFVSAFRFKIFFNINIL